MKVANKKFGFTLVELLIALSILSFVMVLCASGFKFGSRVWERVDSQSVHIDSLQAIQSFLRSSLSHSLIRDRLQEERFDEGQLVAKPLENLFIGELQTLSYVSRSPQYGVDDYLYKYQLYLNKQSNSLVLRYTPYNLKQVNDHYESLSLIEGVSNIEIRYFSGFYDDDEKSSWLSKWDDIYSLPLLVKVDVTFVDESKRWPELVIPMRHGPYVLR